MRIACRGTIALLTGAEIPPAYNMVAPGDGGLVGSAPLLECVKPAERRTQGVADIGDDDAIQPEGVHERLNMLPEEIQRNQNADARIFEMAFQLFFPIQGIGHDRRGARLHDAPEGDDGLRQIGQHDCHAIPGMNAAAVQGRGEAFGVFA